MTESLRYRILRKIQLEYHTAQHIAPALGETTKAVWCEIEKMADDDWDLLPDSYRGRPWVQINNRTGYVTITTRGREALIEAGRNVHIGRSEERRWTEDRQAGFDGKGPAPRGENAVVSTGRKREYCLNPEEKAQREKPRPESEGSVTYSEGLHRCVKCSEQRGKSIYWPEIMFSKKGNGLHSYCKKCRARMARERRKHKGDAQ